MATHVEVGTRGGGKMKFAAAAPPDRSIGKSREKGKTRGGPVAGVNATRASGRLRLSGRRPSAGGKIGRK